VVSLNGGPALTLVDKMVDLGGVSWGEDGYIYYDGHLPGDGIARVRESGGEPEVVTIPDSTSNERYHNMPVALPGGHAILMTVTYAAGGQPTAVAVFDLKTHKHRILARGIGARYAASGHLLWVTAEGTLMAAPFDLGKQDMVGDAVTILSGIAVTGNQRIDIGFSRDGVATYIQGSALGAGAELVWVTRNGTATQVDPGWVQPMIGAPSLSPDGKRVAVTVGQTSVDGNVWVKQLDRGPASKLSDPGFSPKWGNDPSTVYFASFAGLRKAPADNSAPATTLVPSKGRSMGMVEVQPDGQRMLMVTAGRLLTSEPDNDTALANLDVSTGAVNTPDISPDGRWVTFTSDETGRPEIYVRPYPDFRRAKYQVSPTGGIRPRWSRDGRELFFADENSMMQAVSVTPGPAPTFGTPKPLFSALTYLSFARGFDVAADGRFLMLRSPQGQTLKREELILVQNFFEELKAKAPIKR